MSPCCRKDEGRSMDGGFVLCFGGQLAAASISAPVCSLKVAAPRTPSGHVSPPQKRIVLRSGGALRLLLCFSTVRPPGSPTSRAVPATTQRSALP
ncbi:hypothetical protein GDO78_000898 [Eleutherodactylus coqui]|uniref:Uncharacterized protein n=1 Tax=Eleutherodactylus coqui TaxID=57060 RepID=A0A8J6KIA9_ELECQ|nr:hypothetical protein GDO78_000898 [Eleutherodactylus coqui]